MELLSELVTVGKDAGSERIDVYGPFPDNHAFQFSLVISALNDRHASSLVRKLRSDLKERQIRPASPVAKRDESGWIIIDCINIIIHIISEELRQYYELDEWYKELETTVGQ